MSVTVKKKTVKAPIFEKKMLGLLKMVKGMDIDESTKNILLEEIRHIHISCLEWEEPKEEFEIPTFLRRLP